MNPNFGILRNGTIVVGYLTEDHILNLSWVNLVQGIIWLVRQGKVRSVFMSGKARYDQYLCLARQGTISIYVWQGKLCPVFVWSNLDLPHIQILVNKVVWNSCNFLLAFSSCY